jgi:hypothetical protein
MSFMVGKSSAKYSLKLHLLWLGMQPLYQHVKICDLRPCYTVQFFIQLVSQCLKKDFDMHQVARGVTRCNDFHATRNDRGQRHAKRLWRGAIWRQILIKVKRVLGGGGAIGTLQAINIARQVARSRVTRCNAKNN